MSNTNKSESNLPADAKCEENDQVGSPNLIDRASHSNLLPDCGNPGKVRENPAVQATPENVPRKLLTMHRKLMVDIKRSRGALLKCKTKGAFRLDAKQREATRSNAKQPKFDVIDSSRKVEG